MHSTREPKKKVSVADWVSHPMSSLPALFSSVLHPLMLAQSNVFIQTSNFYVSIFCETSQSQCTMYASRKSVWNLCLPLRLRSARCSPWDPFLLTASRKRNKDDGNPTESTRPGISNINHKIFSCKALESVQNLKTTSSRRLHQAEPQHDEHVPHSICTLFSINAGI